MGMTKEGMIHGMVEHIMIEGGTLGTPGSEYALESMPPENPAMSVRIYKEEDGKWEPTAYSIGMMHNDAKIVDMENHSMDNSDNGMDAYDNSIGKSYHSDDEEMDKWNDESLAPTQGFQIRPKGKEIRLLFVGVIDGIGEGDVGKAGVGIDE